METVCIFPIGPFEHKGSTTYDHVVNPLSTRNIKFDIQMKRLGAKQALRDRVRINMALPTSCDLPGTLPLVREKMSALQA